MAYQPDPFIASLGAAQTPQQIQAARNAATPAPTPNVSLTSTFNSAMGGKSAPVVQSAPAGGSSGGNGGSNTAPVATSIPSTTNAQGVNTGAAPAGSKLSANGNWVDSAGNQYTTAPAGNTAGGGGTSGPTPGSNAHGTVGPDSAYGAGMSALAPGAVPSEADFYSQVYNQLSPVISAINSAETASETAAYAAGTKESVSLAGEYGARGLAGGSDAAHLAGQVGLDTAGAIANAQNARASALSDITKFAIPQAYTAYTDALTRNDANSKAYIAQQQTNMVTALAGLATSGVTLSSLQTTNPTEYNQLLQYANGDANTLAELYIQAATKNNSLLNGGQPLTTSGNTLVYGIATIGPDGKPTLNTQSLTLPFDLPSTYGWKVTSTGSNSSLLSDPNNGANYIAYYTDPVTNEVTATGSGTGLDALKAAGITPGVPGNAKSGSSSSSSAASSTASTNYLNTVSSTSGVTDLSTPFTSVDVSKIASGIVSAEGGSPGGVVNNPGNVKYVAGMTGATDSGVKAADGGTFASFDTLANGQAAIQNTLNAIAGNMGSGATTQQVLDTYANLSGGGTAATTGSNGLSTTTYGLLANVSGFDPGNPTGTQTKAQVIDQGAFNYLQSYLSGSAPSSSSGMGGIPAKVYNSAIQARASQLYTDATGQPLPDATRLKANQTLITGNTAMLNSLGINAPTISENAKLMIGKMTAGNINQNAPAINAVIDPIINAMGNPDVASYMAQNQTLSNELGSLLALKGASGSGASTVHDKLVAAGLISPNASAAQEATTVNTIMQEAGNAQSAIATQNMKLYLQTDPMMIDSSNPLNDPSTTFVDPTGKAYPFAKGSVSPTEAASLLSAGYTLQ